MAHQLDNYGHNVLGIERKEWHRRVAEAIAPYHTDDQWKYSLSEYAFSSYLGRTSEVFAEATVAYLRGEDVPQLMAALLGEVLR